MELNTTIPDGLAGARVHYARWGTSGPRVLLVHAIGFDHHTWELVTPYLQDGYQLVALDLPGHGESDKPANADYSLGSLAARVIAFLDELGWDDAVLAGNSLGGGTSLAVAVRAPERVRGLALLDSVGFRAGLPHLGRLAFLPLAPILTTLAPPLAMRVGLETVRARWGSVTDQRCDAAGRYFRSAEGRAAFFRTLRQLYGPDLDWMAWHYRDIRCPTLVLQGERDPLIRLSHAQRLAETIPKAELIRIPRCGHFPQEERPEVVGRELRRFLDRITAARDPGASGEARPASERD